MSVSPSARITGCPGLLAPVAQSGAAPDVDVSIGVVKAQLRYSKTSFHARPGAKVKLTFDNDDELQHNLIVCRGGEGAWKTVADAALKLGAQGVDKGWLPDSELILAATRMLNPHEKQTIEFTAPDEEGVYPYVCTFPGHAQIMRGEMVVSRFERGLGDLRYRYFEGGWDKLPDFATMQPAATGKLESNRISLAPRKRNDDFGFAFEGELTAPTDGKYRFTLSSDDGSRLLIDGKQVIDNDGIHGNQQRSGEVALKQGAHRIEVQYFERGGGEELLVSWAGPGFKSEALTEGRTIEYIDLAEFLPVVLDRAKVVRVRLPDASPRSMAIGLPGGTSLCFDTTSCSIRYAWSGGFVDTSSERGSGKGRGGGVCKILGDRWDVGEEAMAPELLDDHAKPRFGGYRIDGGAVELSFTAGGKEITQRVSAPLNGGALEIEFVGSGQKITAKQP